MSGTQDKAFNTARILIHVTCWGLIFGFPFLFMLNHGNSSIDWMGYLKRLVVILSYCIVFYINYFLLIPKLLFKERQKKFLSANAAIVLIFCACLQLWQKQMMPEVPPRPLPPRVNPFILFLLRDSLIMVLTIGLATAIRLNVKWTNAENARKDAEKSRAEAELKNLRNQLNPHFLLNTLNNIYALIEFDTDKAKAAVKELSRLLRYVLYENQQQTVPLTREMDFINDYISLMKIRLSPNIRLTTEFNIDGKSRKMIAPLVFISLIENAFKHGTSPGNGNFISIAFDESADAVTCHIENSLHPKDGSDKSGSGIGLEQVRRRLELLYPGRYEWKYGISEEGNIYFSTLRIITGQNDDTEMCHNR